MKTKAEIENRLTTLRKMRDVKAAALDPIKSIHMPKQDREDISVELIQTLSEIRTLQWVLSL